ncbi:phosphoribulokinase / uridine kinase family protein [Nitzschia inconspicua]|uniref:Phosphoribulokinase / uridine kinase family protein n=1 Tax=Nitzschia inconspicua TaxID=303405 RepID=A0A9K3KVM9_9STRA|nr:phosphoribulokinase / uridine kinase family protein [Nitzschia inconspicua]
MSPNAETKSGHSQDNPVVTTGKNNMSPEKSYHEMHNIDYPNMEHTYDALAQKLRGMVAERQRQRDGVAGNKEATPHEQLWVALAGGPGSGKSTVAEAVVKRLNQEKEVALIIPMDGWHLTKKQVTEKYGDDGMRRRGAPWTFHVEEIEKDLQRAKKQKEGSFPMYSRDISDPVQDAKHLKKTHEIVIVEGLYVLWKEDEQWGKLYDLFDERWFVKVPSREEQICRLVKRSKQNWFEDKEKLWGPYPEGARKRAEYNDVKNMDLVASCEEHADEVIMSR